MLITTIVSCLRAMQVDLSFVYLNFRNHPRGQTMLAALLDAGFTPTLVIEEDSPLGRVGVEEQRNVLGEPVGDGGDVEALCRARAIPYHTVDDHNGPECTALIQEHAIHVAILGDTRILREPLISVCNLGVINVHPGVLPDVRGNNPYVWAIVEGKSQGVTVHFIDHGVDTGPILFKRVLEPVPSTYPELIRTINALCATALVETLQQFRSGVLNLSLQPVGGPVTRKAASAELKRIAAEKLLANRALP